MLWDSSDVEQTDEWTGRSDTEWKSTYLERNERNFNDARPKQPITSFRIPRLQLQKYFQMLIKVG